MRGEQIDIVHTHLSKAGILGRLAAWLAGVPVIVHTFHGDVLEGYFSALKSWAFTMAERLVGRVTHRFVCVSEGLQKRLVGYKLGPSDAFCVISNGIVVDDFESVDREKKYRVGTLAMFYPVKRLDLFVQMAHRLHACHPKVQYDIAGDGMEADALRRLSTSHGEPVNFLGICRDRSEFLKSLDVFVLCSDFEGAGMSLMEAMAAGVAVVATRVGGVPEIVQDGETGVLIPPDNLDALCEAVRDLLGNDEQRHRLGNAARQYAQAHFSHTNMVAELDVMYRDLVEHV
jgi:glycosyltransferase involved in cell wall biosynthesis